MSAQIAKNPIAHSEQTATLIAVKSAGAPIIAHDSDELIGYWRDQTEVFLNELTKLRCLSGLLNGQVENSNAVNMSELCWLIDPSVERLKDICDELSELFYKKQVAFIQTDSERPNKTDAA